MRRIQTLGLLVAAALAACSPEPEPARPSLSFRTDGATYVWSVSRGQTPALMLGAAVVAVAAGLAITLVAGPLYGLSERAAEDLVSPQGYVTAVLEGAP